MGILLRDKIFLEIKEKKMKNMTCSTKKINYTQPTKTTKNFIPAVIRFFFLYGI